MRERPTGSYRNELVASFEIFFVLSEVKFILASSITLKTDHTQVNNPGNQ